MSYSFKLLFYFCNVFFGINSNCIVAKGLKKEIIKQDDMLAPHMDLQVLDVEKQFVIFRQGEKITAFHNCSTRAAALPQDGRKGL